MHTTTVRFPPETWAQLKEHCAGEGIATAQYIREATTARLFGRPTPLEEAMRQELDEMSGRLASVERELRRRALRGR
jgi:hypothetical protein